MKKNKCARCLEPINTNTFHPKNEKISVCSTCGYPTERKHQFLADLSAYVILIGFVVSLIVGVSLFLNSGLLMAILVFFISLLFFVFLFSIVNTVIEKRFDASDFFMEQIHEHIMTHDSFTEEQRQSSIITSEIIKNSESFIERGDKIAMRLKLIEKRHKLCLRLLRKERWALNFKQFTVSEILSLSEDTYKLDVIADQLDALLYNGQIKKVEDYPEFYNLYMERLNKVRIARKRIPIIGSNLLTDMRTKHGQILKAIPRKEMLIVKQKESLNKAEMLWEDRRMVSDANLKMLNRKIFLESRIPEEHKIKYHELDYTLLKAFDHFYQTSLETRKPIAKNFNEYWESLDEFNLFLDQFGKKR